MKILYITPDIKNSGGIAKVISLKTDYLISKLDYEVHILTVNENDSDFFFEFNPSIQWIKINRNLNSLFFLWRYLRLIKKTISNKNPDIIVICDAVYWILIPWLIIINKPIVFETHVSVNLKKILKKGFLNTFRFRIVQFLKEHTVKKFNKLVLLSNDALAEWNTNNCVIIPNPIDLNNFLESNFQNNNAITVCRHGYEKGLDRLLLIWKEIISQHPDWNLNIYGEWNFDFKYQKMAVNLEISKNVNFIAPVINIESFYQNSSIYLMTSRSEALPLVLIEAMASGLPCIAYDCPVGPRAIIKNNENGFLIEDGNKEFFVEKLNLLIEDEKLRKEMGQRAKTSVDKYDLETIMLQWKNLFETIIKT